MMKLAFSACILGLVFFGGVSLAQALIINDYQLAGKKRISRTVFEYTYTAIVQNEGPDATDVSAVVSSANSNIEIVDADVVFGNVPSGRDVASTDTFSIRQDRRYKFDAADLTWDISFSQLPPDPAEVASENDLTVATTVAQSTAFLYQGDNPIQRGVAPGTMEPLRAAVIRGKVRDREDDPLSGVTITVLNHPEYGYTQTRSDGMFDMAVNGGGWLSVRYRKPGFFTVDRSVRMPWQDYAWLPEVTLIEPDPVATEINLTGSEPLQTALGSRVTDEDGNRQPVLMFPSGTQAQMIFEDGSTQSLGTLNVRATEYTVGTSGFQAMPGELPSNIGYTYAIEFSIDEALTAGAAKVDFSKPIIHYVENFLNAEVGSPVPTGYYDRENAVWVASDNGRVIEVLSIADGVALLDVDGSGTPADEIILNELGISDQERQGIADNYSTGQTLWRVPIAHFSAWDCNWPISPPDDATPPPKKPEPKIEQPENDPCKKYGSVIECQNQILGESIRLVGTPERLHYQSDRAPGFKASYSVDITLSGDAIPASLTAIELEIDIAGNRLKKVWTTSAACSLSGSSLAMGNVETDVAALLEGGYAFISNLIVPEAHADDAAGMVADPLFMFLNSPFYLNYCSNDVIIIPDLRNQTYTYTWNGLDAYGREVQGRQPVTIRVGFTYRGVYQKTDRFGYNGNGTISGSQTRGTVTLWKEWEKVLGAWDQRALELGGWSLSNHHSYDVVSKTLYLGNGRRVMANAIPPAIGTALSSIASVRDIAMGDDGSLYIADAENFVVRKMDIDGNITIVAGNGYSGYEGDGGPATEARMEGPSALAIGPDGSLYIAESNHRIRKVDPDGIITTVVGQNGAGYSGDGGPASEASIWLGHHPGITVDLNGNLYIADNVNCRIRRIDAEGVITTVAGTGVCNDNGDDDLATQAGVYYPTDVAAGGDGSIYVVTDGRIRRLRPDGIINTIAGDGTYGYSGDGGPAADATFRFSSYATRIEVGRDGSLYISDGNNHRVRRIDPDGIIKTFAGTGIQGLSGDHGYASRAQLSDPKGLASSPDGSLYIADYGNNRIRVVKPVLPGMSFDDIVLPSEDGEEIYYFDSSGCHLRTLHALTGGTLYSFNYDKNGFLIESRDGYENTLTIERDTDGTPMAIVAPFGQRTLLKSDANGYLDTVTNPAGEAHYITFSADGLMAEFENPKGNSNLFEYDSDGRLTREEDPAGGYKNLHRQDVPPSDSVKGGYDVTVTTSMERQSTYRVEDLADGGKHQVNTYECCGSNDVQIGMNGSREIVYHTGDVHSYSDGPDPRFGMMAPLMEQEVITTPSGLSAVWETQRQLTLSDPLDILSLTHLSDTLTLNGRSFKSDYDSASRTFTRTTPQGRSISSQIDTIGKPLQHWIAGIEPLNLAYDALGRIEGLNIGDGQTGRRTRFDYNSAGYVESITDPLQRSIQFDYDLAGRITQSTLPNQNLIRFGYDANGNVTSIIPPGRPAHLFTYDTRNLLERYAPPSVASAGTLETVYSYNLDKQLTQLRRPDGKTIVYGYDTKGRLESLQDPEGTISYTYDPDKGHLSKIYRSSGQELDYTYDGALLTSVAWSGPAEGAVNMTYNNDFQLATRSVNGGLEVNYAYDADGLRIQVGELEVIRDPTNGRITGTTIGNIADGWTFNSFGDPIGYSAVYGGTNVFSATYERDELGRIKEKTETIEGKTYNYIYAYDLMGRLEAVVKDNAEIARYQYDANGNRRTLITPAATVDCDYDDQDRLVSCNDANYVYTPNGELMSKTTGGSNTTTYQYDVFGALTRVELSDGTTIEYLIDGENRRVGKRVNGIITQMFLYKDQLNPIAELDGDGNLVSRFVYGIHRHVPDYMIRNGQTYRIVSDHLGSPRLVVNIDTGDIAQRMDYDEFGNLEVNTNPGFQPFGFAGGIFDDLAGLVHFGSRDYDPQLGRWTCKDLIGFNGLNTNLYAYVHSDPVNLIDPSGFEACVRGTVQCFSGFAKTIIISGTVGGLLAGPAGAGIGVGIATYFSGLSEEGLKNFNQCVGMICGPRSTEGDIGGNESEINGIVEYGPGDTIIAYPDGTIKTIDPAEINDPNYLNPSEEDEEDRIEEDLPDGC